jgi:hypothetical protein
MNTFDVFWNPPYEQIEDSIKPKKPNLGEFDYYAIMLNGKGIMVELSKKATPQEIVRSLCVEIKKLVERSEPNILDKFKARFR